MQPGGVYDNDLALQFGRSDQVKGVFIKRHIVWPTLLVVRNTEDFKTATHIVQHSILSLDYLII